MTPRPSHPRLASVDQTIHSQPAPGRRHVGWRSTSRCATSRKRGNISPAPTSASPAARMISAARPEFLPALAPPKMPHIPHGGDARQKRGTDMWVRRPSNQEEEASVRAPPEQACGSLVTLQMTRKLARQRRTSQGRTCNSDDPLKTRFLPSALRAQGSPQVKCLNATVASAKRVTKALIELRRYSENSVFSHFSELGLWRL